MLESNKKQMEHFKRIIEVDSQRGLDDFQLYFTVDEIIWLVKRSETLGKIEHELNHSDLNDAIERILDIVEKADSK